MPSNRKLLAAGKLVRPSDRWTIATHCQRSGVTLNDSARFPATGKRLWLTDVPAIRTTFLTDSKR